MHNSNNHTNRNTFFIGALFLACKVTNFFSYLQENPQKNHLFGDFVCKCRIFFVPLRHKTVLSMLRRVQQYISRHALLPPGARVLVCVSGGADSMAMLDVLRRGGYTCIVAHCNFHLRGEASNADEVFVRTFCEQNRLACFVESFDTEAVAQACKQSIEVAARELRYRWFARLAREQGCEAIAVAHHQNDQAETVVLNLLRGSGLRGLGGMRPLSPNPVTPDSVNVIRPLLCTTHDYIVHYLRDIRHLSWREDATNADTSIPRNAIRHWLNSRTKGEIENICHTADMMQGYADKQDGVTSRARDLIELYEQLRAYKPKETEAIYEAMQRGESGKCFRLDGATLTIRKHGYTVSKDKR